MVMFVYLQQHHIYYLFWNQKQRRRNYTPLMLWFLVCQVPYLHLMKLFHIVEYIPQFSNLLEKNFVVIVKDLFHFHNNCVMTNY